MRYFYLFLSIFFNVLSYILFKSISSKAVDVSWFLLLSVGLIFGGINILCFTKALKNINLSLAYPVFSGTSIFLMIILSHFIFGERMSAMNIVGAGVIVAGIALISY